MARTWQDILSLTPTEPERQLIEACKAGEICVLGDGTRPEGPDPARTLRAEVLRYLILGGCQECRGHEQGVRLAGAWVSGELDLSFARASGQTSLVQCRFKQPVRALQTRFEVLNLSGSALPDLNAQGAEVTGDVFLRNGFAAEGAVSLLGAQIGGQLGCGGGRFKNAKGFALNAEGVAVKDSVFLHSGFAAEGEVSLSGAQIGGQLGCGGGRFTNARGRALNAQGVEVKGDVFLHNGFAAEGAVSLSGTQIGGQLDCAGGQFTNARGDALNAQGVEVKGDVFLRTGFTAEGAVSLSGARIGGQLDFEGGRFTNAKGDALNAQRLRVAEGLFWRDVEVAEGRVDLTSAHVGDLVDDLQSWPEAGRLYLDGFTYERISAAFTDVPSRLDWLERGTLWKGDFHPQPYTQLAKVLREMGHDRAARAVAIERRRLTTLHDWRRAHRALDGNLGPALRSIRADLGRIGDFLSRIVVGYGYLPFRSLWSLSALWLIATFLAHMAWERGAMVPNSDVILTSAGWLAVEARPDAGPYWAGTAPGQDWETFNRYAWGLDVVVPILDLGQAATWAPSRGRGGWGSALWWARWVLQVCGWVVVGLFAAAVTGIIRREEE